MITDPIFDKNGKTIETTIVTPGGIQEVPVMEMENYDSVFEGFFKDKPVGATATYTNHNDDVLEITKVSNSLYDAIHHFSSGGQEAIRRIPVMFVVCEIFMGHYDLNSLTETDTFLFDDSEKSEVKVSLQTDGNDEHGVGTGHLHLEKEAPDGNVEMLDRGPFHVDESVKNKFD